MSIYKEIHYRWLEEENYDTPLSISLPTDTNLRQKKTKMKGAEKRDRTNIYIYKYTRSQ